MAWLLRKFLVPLLAVLVLPLAAVWLLRLAAPGAGHAQALALLEVPPPPAPGENAFALLVLTDYRIPPDQREAVVAEDVAAYAAWWQAQARRGDMLDTVPGPGAGAGAAGHVAVAEGRFERIAPSSADPSVCALRDGDCLARVRTDPGLARAELAQSAELAALARAALGRGHLREGYLPTLQAPQANTGLLRLALLEAALMQVDGQAPAALAQACRVAAAGRRFNRHATGLVTKLVSAALAEAGLGLALDLRRDAPGQPLPPACNEALAEPLPAERLVCEAMRGEYAVMASAPRELALATGGSARGWVLRAYLHDERLMAAWTAPPYAEACREDRQAQILAGQLPPEPAPAIGFADPTCYGAYVSCVLAQIPAPGVVGYQARLLDHDARLRLLLAAHRVESGEPADAVAAALVIPGYTPRFDPASGRLGVDLRQPRDGAARDYAVMLRAPAVVPVVP